MRAVLQSINKRLNISPENFLIRIPKFYLWKNSSVSMESRLTTTATDTKTPESDYVVLLKYLNEAELVSDVKTKNAIKAVLTQIETEKKNQG